MNNPTILDVALGFVLHKHSGAWNKACAIRELSDEEMAVFLNELVTQEDNCPRTVMGWKEWLSGKIK